MMPVLRRSLFLLGCLLAASCNSNAPYYSVQITSPDTVSLTPGESSQFDMTVARVAELPGEVRVTLETAPDGITLAPDIVLPASEASVTVPVTVSVAADVQVSGTQRMILLATDSAQDFASGATLFVVVLPRPESQPDFSISVEPRQVSLFAGQKERVQVTVTRAEGFTGQLTLSVEAPTKRVSSIPQVITPEQTTATFVLLTESSITRLPVPVTIIATSEDGRTARTGATLNVR